MLPDALRQPPPDAGGRTLEQDIAEHLQAPDNVKAIEEARRAVPPTTETGARASATPELAALRALVEAEMCRSYAIFTQWSERRSQRHHVQLIDALIARLPASERDQWDVRVSVVAASEAFSQRALGDAVAACGTPASDREARLSQFQARFREFARPANLLRGELATRIDELAGASSATEEAWVARSSPCPPASGETSGQERPSRVHAADLGEFYPPDERIHGVSGRVRVRIEIDATGCVARVSVVGSSGAPALDEASQKWAFQMQFLPGIKDGNPVGARFIQPITFSALQEGDTPAQANPTRN
jgi:TonB family protein